jgi:hypothetical protein
MTQCVVCLETTGAPGSESPGLRLCDRCVDGLAHVSCLAEWARSAPNLPLSCPLCRGSLTAQSARLTSMMARERGEGRSVARVWPMILFAVQMILGFVSLSVGLEGAGHEAQAAGQRKFGTTVFLADAALIAYVTWRHELLAGRGARAPAPHPANRLADTVAVAVCLVMWVLYEAEQVVAQLLAGTQSGGPYMLQGRRGAGGAFGDDTRATLHAAYLMLSYLMLYTFMMGAELSRSGVWRLQYLCSCFLYACITGSSLAGGAYLSSPPLYVAFVATTCFWLACTVVAASGGGQIA